MAAMGRRPEVAADAAVAEGEIANSRSRTYADPSPSRLAMAAVFRRGGRRSAIGRYQRSVLRQAKAARACTSEHPPRGAVRLRGLASLPAFGVGASARGLVACRELMDVLSAGNGLRPAWSGIISIRPAKSVSLELLAGRSR